jgi:hypothetical protein
MIDDALCGVLGGIGATGVEVTTGADTTLVLVVTGVAGAAGVVAPQLAAWSAARVRGPT